MLRLVSASMVTLAVQAVVLVLRALARGVGDLRDVARRVVVPVGVVAQRIRGQRQAVVGVVIVVRRIAAAVGGAA